MDDSAILLTPPDSAEVAFIGRGLVSALGGPLRVTVLQDLLIRASCHSMTGHELDTAATTPITPDEFALGMSRRNEAFRARIVQLMLLAAFVERPLPPETVDSLSQFATALAVQDDMIEVAQRFATGALDLANADFARNGYLGEVSPTRLAALHAVELDSSWGASSNDHDLASTWLSMADLPAGTLGRGIADFYRDRGFVVPGLPGSAPPLLAQHDWVHVLAGYGTSLENEIEVFAFMARANDDPRAFSLLAMVLSLFQTGYLAAGAGLFEADPGHLQPAGMAARLADAMRRGALTTGSHDFLDLDWFTLADRPVEVIRLEIGLVPKDATALAAGSVSAWEVGGITPFQVAAARRFADTTGAEYVPWHADPTRA